MTRRYVFSLILALVLCASAFAQNTMWQDNTLRSRTQARNEALVLHKNGKAEFVANLYQRAAAQGVSVTTALPSTPADTLLIGGNNTIFAVSGQRNPNKADTINIVGYEENVYFGSVGAGTVNGVHTIFGSAGSYLYRFNDQGGLNVASDTNVYVGVAPFDNFYLSTLGQISAVNIQTPELIHVNVAPTTFTGAVSSGRSQANGFSSAAPLSTGGTLAIDPNTGKIWFFKTETDGSPVSIATVYGGVSLAVDGSNLYIAVASLPADMTVPNSPMLPSLILKTQVQQLTPFGSGVKLTPFTSVKGAAPQISFSPHGIVARAGRIYWFNDTDGGPEIRLFDTNSNQNSVWLPRELTNGANNMAFSQ